MFNYRKVTHSDSITDNYSPWRWFLMLHML